MYTSAHLPAPAIYARLPAAYLIHMRETLTRVEEHLYHSASQMLTSRSFQVARRERSTLPCLRQRSHCLCKLTFHGSLQPHKLISQRIGVGGGKLLEQLGHGLECATVLSRRLCKALLLQVDRTSLLALCKGHHSGQQLCI